MGALTYEEQNNWRVHIKCRLEKPSEGYLYRVHVINPVEYYNFQDKRHESDYEVMNFDLHKLKQSDLVIANFNEPKSLGTMAEIATAFELRIPIIGLNEKGEDLHPWQNEMCERIFDNIDDMLDYIDEFYLS